MDYKFKFDQPEEYYRKLLLLDKVKPFIDSNKKIYIFFMGYCWDILFKDKDASFLCYSYAKYSLKGPFLEGETVIAQNYHHSLGYAVSVLHGPFPQVEQTFEKRFLSNKNDISDLKFAYLYARDVLKDRFPLGELVISSDPWFAYLYSLTILKEPWPEVEHVIATNAEYAFKYAMAVLKKPFPLGEPIIMNSTWEPDYLKFIESIS